MGIARFRRPIRRWSLVAVALAAFAAPGTASLRAGREAPPPTPSGPSPRAFSAVRFEENRGQADSRVSFLARSQGYTLFVARDEAVFVPHAPGGGPARAVRMRVGEGARAARVEGVGPLGGRSNYLRGADPACWLRGIPSYARVVARGAAPGVDLEFRGKGPRVEYALRFAAGADPAASPLEFRGADGLEIAPSGDLLVKVPGGLLRHSRPVAWQGAGSARRPVECAWTLAGPSSAALAAGPRDGSLPLFVDPEVSYSTYLGGPSTEGAYAAAAGADGSAYLTGTTYAASFPVEGSGQAFGGLTDVFVSKFTPSGDGLVYSTFIGGSGADLGLGMAVDAAGAAFVVGRTFSTDFPMVGAAHGTFAGIWDAFVLEVSPGGASLVYSTFLGGSKYDAANGVSLAADGSAVVVGETRSADLPVTAGAFQAAIGTQTAPEDSDAFVARIDADGSEFSFVTYLGGPGIDTATAVAAAPDGSCAVAGVTYSTGFPVASALQATRTASFNAFVTRVNAEGTGLAWSTYLGGNGGESAGGVAFGPGGSVVVVGATLSTNFPTTAGAFQEARTGAGQESFATRIAADGSAREWSTYLGVSNLGAVALDGDGAVWIGGSSGYGGYAFVTPDAAQSEDAGVDGLLLCLSPSGDAMTYATLLGGAALDVIRGVACDGHGSVVAAGETYSPDFLLANPFQSINFAPGEAFASRIRRPTLAGGSLRGSLVDSAAAGRDRLQVVASVAFEGLSAGASFDSAVDALELGFGDPQDPFIVAVPAGDPRWTARRGKLTWTSPPRSSPQVRIVYDPARATGTFTVSKFDFPSPPGASGVLLRLHLGDNFLDGVAAWEAGRHGRLRLR